MVLRYWRILSFPLPCLQPWKKMIFWPFQVPILMTTFPHCSRDSIPCRRILQSHLKKMITHSVSSPLRGVPHRPGTIVPFADTLTWNRLFCLLAFGQSVFQLLQNRAFFGCGSMAFIDFYWLRCPLYCHSSAWLHQLQRYEFGVRLTSSSKRFRTQPQAWRMLPLRLLLRAMNCVECPFSDPKVIGNCGPCEDIF